MKIFGEGKLSGEREACMKFAQENGLLDAMTIGFHTPAQIDDVLAADAPLAGETAGLGASRKTSAAMASPAFCGATDEECYCPKQHRGRLRDRERFHGCLGGDHVAEAFFPEIVIALVDSAAQIAIGAFAGPEQRLAEGIAPHGVIGRVDDAVAVVVAGGDRRRARATGRETAASRIRRW